MEIGLCMIVKDEAKFIHSSLEGVVDQVDDVVVIDTGSTDGTLEILTNDFGLTPLDWRLDGENCYSKCAALNEGFSRLESDWVFILDADERIDAGELARVQALEDDPGVSGYFCAWNTHKGAEVIEDYKLCLFRKGIEKRGLIHDNAQFEIRTRNLRADWLPGLAISHHPDDGKDGQKSALYKDRLLCAISREPDWVRYHWFLGYMHFRENQPGRAVDYLSTAAESHSELFPVECLNAKIVLAEIHAASGREPELGRVLASALLFHGRVADDFEVKINFRLRPWIDNALDLLRLGSLGEIRAYKFSF